MAGTSRRVVVAIALAGMAAGASPAGAQEPDVPPESVRALTTGQTQFAVELLQRIAGKPGNAFFSPYSISTALGMARAGAAGETAKQMDATLHLPPAAGTAYRALVELVTHPRSTPVYAEDGRTRVQQPVYALNVANGVFVQSGWAFEPAFRGAVGGDYGAEFRELDYKQQAEARKAINDWVATQTKDRIKDIVPEGLPTTDTRMALANAIHFKAQWEEAFREEATETKPFTVKTGTDVEARMMHRTHRLQWGETEDAAFVEIPYRGGDMTMVVVLPKAKDGLDAVVKGLTGEKLRAAITAMTGKKVALGLPKFTFTSQTDLAKVLPQMGMTDAFSSAKADFTGITKKEPLFIGAVLHKAFVAVDEKGTEAAAATVVMMRAGSAMRPDDPVPFVVDHPFLFLIRHPASGAVLFLGRVDDPTAK